MIKGQPRARAAFDILGKIKYERDKRGWSDYELAEYSGITPSTISTWYRRGIEPGIASLEKICEGFGITLSEFFAEDNSSTSNKCESIMTVIVSLSPKQRNALIEMIKAFKE